MRAFRTAWMPFVLAKTLQQHAAVAQNIGEVCDPNEGCSNDAACVEGLCTCQFAGYSNACPSQLVWCPGVGATQCLGLDHIGDVCDPELGCTRDANCVDGLCTCSVAGFSSTCSSFELTWCPAVGATQCVELVHVLESGSTCYRDDQCQLGLVCKTRQPCCFGGNTCQCNSEANTGCPEGRICESFGRCTLVGGDSCERDGDCFSSSCKESICQPLCSDDEDCVDGEFCVGYLFPLLSLEPKFVCRDCRTNEDCPGELVCTGEDIFGRPYECDECTSFLGCSNAQVCLSGRCQDNPCESSEDCPLLQFCDDVMTCQLSPVCFAGDVMVNVQDHAGLVPMRLLKIGDWVQVDEEGSFEPIYSFGHHNQAQYAQFIEIAVATPITTETEMAIMPPLKMSPEHMIWTFELGYVPASSLEVGHTLMDGTTGDTVPITSIRHGVKSLGVFAPFTPSGTIVVNNLVASTYVSMQKDTGRLLLGGFSTWIRWQWLVHSFESPRRIVCVHLASWNNKTGCVGETYTADGISSGWISNWLEVSGWLLQDEHNEFGWKTIVVILMAELFTLIGLLESVIISLTGSFKALSALGCLLALPWVVVSLKSGSKKRFW